MSLIHTCQLCGANPFEYLTELQQHGEELSRSPEHWMPWNYRHACTAGVRSPLRWSGIGLDFPLFGAAHSSFLFRPIDVLKAEATDFANAQAVDRAKQKLLQMMVVR